MRNLHALLARQEPMENGGQLTIFAFKNGSPGFHLSVFQICLQHQLALCTRYTNLLDLQLTVLCSRWPPAKKKSVARNLVRLSKRTSTEWFSTLYAKCPVLHSPHITVTFCTLLTYEYLRFTRGYLLWVIVFEYISQSEDILKTTAGITEKIVHKKGNPKKKWESENWEAENWESANWGTNRVQCSPKYDLLATVQWTYAPTSNTQSDD